MKATLYIFLAGIILFISGCSSNRSETSDNRVVIGKIDSLHSKILNEERKIWVYVPATNPTFARKNFPVVYLLDGDAHFYSVMGMIQQLSEVNGNMIVPQMILVGIPNTDRTRDLTPTHVSSDREIDTAFLKPSGGGEKFTAFLEKELIPYIDSVYPAAKYRTLIGHSLGGLMVINTLINHTDLFNAYLSIDPSMWWDNRNLLKQAEKVLGEKDFKGTTLFLSVANTMNPGMDTTKVKNDTTNDTRHIRSILELGKSVEMNRKSNLKFSWKYYNNDDHGSVPLIAEYDAMRFIFDFYKPDIEYSRMKEPSYNIDSVLRRYSEKLSANFGFSSTPPESFINQLGYGYMGLKLYDKASILFKLNIEYYPESANVYDSMGEFLAVKGDTTASIASYEKSLKLYPKNENARTRIAKMKEKLKGK